MTPALFRRAMRGALARTAHVTPVPAGRATGVVAEVYAALEREFGLLAPPVALHSPAPDLLVTCWTLLRETLLVPGVAPRAVKEAVAAGVSLANACPYCVEVHSAVLGGVHDRADARAIGAGRVDGVANPALRAVTAWARDGGPAPFDRSLAPEMLAVLFAFHYVNRMVHVFLGPSPLPPALPAALGGMVSTMLGTIMAPTTRLALTPSGAGPAADLPGDLDWVRPHPVLAAVLARSVATVEGACSRVLDEPTRAAVWAALAIHPGDPGAGTAWLDDAVAGLPEPARPAAALALKTALAPYRVVAADVEACRARAGGAGDADLLAVTAWASLTAARDRARRAAAACHDPVAA